MIPSSSLLLSAGGALLCYALFKILDFFLGQLRSPLRDLRGPQSSHFFYGDLKQIWPAEGPTLQETWVEEYGTTFRYKGPLLMDRLFTMDTKAINHVLTNSYDYWKPEGIRYTASRIFGKGLLIEEGDKHRHQRRIVNPAFGQGQIRALTEVFIAKSVQLRDLWFAEILEQGQESARIDVLSWLSRAALDIIGIAGFNYKFDSLEPSIDENTHSLSNSFGVVFRTHGRLRLLPLLRSFFPFLRNLPQSSRDKVKNFARTRMTDIGLQLLNDTKASVPGSGFQNGESSTIDNKFLQGRDLLSLLIRANVSRDIPESQRLSEEDVLAQVATFIVTGHETTGAALSWALFALSRVPAVQEKLRKELLGLPTENPTMDELNSLPYLDAVVREIARVHPPVPETIRVAMKDDVLPLNTPIIDKNGVVRDFLRIRKGDTIAIPILAINRSKELWGKDAMEFRPERWERIPEAVNSVPGVWGNTMTFLGGPRNCIAYRFSVVEMKALLFVLVRAFEFELAVPVTDVVKKSSIVVRPMISTSPGNKCQLPLLVKPYNVQST